MYAKLLVKLSFLRRQESSLKSSKLSIILDSRLHGNDTIGNNNAN